MKDSNLPSIDLHKEEKKKHRNDIVRCQKCGMELPRKKIKKHRLSVHAPKKELIILDKSTAKSKSKRACFNCGVQGKDTWLFEKTTRGAVDLCMLCKSKILKLSFSAEEIEKRRLVFLRASLLELRKKKAKLPAGIVDIELVKNIVELEEAIKSPSKPTHRWSPILPGCFGGGKRR